MSSAEIPAPYGTGTQQSGTPSSPAVPSPRKIRTHHLQQFKDQGQKFAMLTAYEQYTAQIFDEAGIEVLLIGDSAANNVYGYETTLPITLDEMIPLCRAVSRSAHRHSWWRICPLVVMKPARSKPWRLPCG